MLCNPDGADRWRSVNQFASRFGGARDKIDVHAVYVGDGDFWDHMTAHREITRTTAGRLRALAMLFVLVLAAAAGMMETADAKTPGRSYCFLGRCHRVLTLAETRTRLGKTEILRASFYDDCARDRFNPCTLTSSGEVFRPGSPDNAASPVYPDGTMLLLYYPETEAAAVVRVNNAGPYHSSRLIDVSVATADALGFRAKGLADLEVRVIASPRAEETSYRRLRRYWPVHGPIGAHRSIAEAHEALVRVSELPRVPARPDSSILVGLPVTAVAAMEPDADQHVSADVPPISMVSHMLPQRADWSASGKVPREELMPIAIASEQFAWSPSLSEDETIEARSPAGTETESGVLAELRARARHGLSPGRLPDVGVHDVVVWLRETAVTLAAHARMAARARIRPNVPARLASIDRAEATPGAISWR